MELPHLGEHCSESTCKQLDFLPIRCDACKKTFCASHYTYELHKCDQYHEKGVQVPVCPLCNCPVTGFKPGDAPDIAVSQHIDNSCKNQTNPIYTVSCAVKRCKKKEIVQIKCKDCHQNFCLTHRHASDHNCQPGSRRNQQSEQAARAAAARAKDLQEQEDEKFAQALQASLYENAAQPPTSRNNRSGRNSSMLFNQQRSIVEQPSCCVS